MAKKNTSKSSKSKGTVKTSSASKPEAKPEAKPVKPSKKEFGKAEKWAVGGIPVETKKAAGVDDAGTLRFASVTIFGHKLSRILRLMGKKGLSTGDAKAIMESLKLFAVRPNTIADKIGEGRNEPNKPAADLSAAEWKKLEALK